MLKIKQGDTQAFRVLTARYRPRLESFARRFLGDAESARDACQEVFVRLWQKAELYRPDGSADAFVYTVAKNVCLRAQEKQRPTVPLDQAPEPAALSGREPDLGIRIARAIHNLPEEQRLVFILSEYEGLSYEEIAQVLGCPRGTVGSRKHAAVKALAAELLEEDE